MGFFNSVPKEIAKLVNQLQDKSYHMRSIAAGELSELSEDPKKIKNLQYAIPALIRSLSDGGHAEIRLDAAKALGNLGDESAVAPLLNGLLDPDILVIQSAGEALSKLRLNDPGMFKSESSAFVQSIALKGDKLLLAFILGMIGDPLGIPFLMEGIKSTDKRTKALCIIALGYTKDKSCIEVLQCILGDKENAWLAISALGNIGVPECIPVLIEFAESDAGKHETFRVFMALLKMKGAGVTEWLIQLLEDRRKELDAATSVRMIKELMALVKPGDKRFVECLETILQDSEVHDPSGSVKKATMEAIKIMG